MNKKPFQREGIRRFFLEADPTYKSFLNWKISDKLFYKWRKFNHSIWYIYWKITKPKYKRIGYF